ncbi:MAG: G1 family glutamic endopeptidase [Phycisphaerae bacterium]
MSKSGLFLSSGALVKNHAGAFAAIATAGLIGLPAGASATSIAPTDFSVVQSGNWAGYIANTTSNTQTFTNVVGSWQVPAVAKPASGGTYSSFWVGLDGSGSPTVEQLGTSSFYTSSGANYYAWYEMYPQPSIAITTMTVKPGDWMNASVQYEGNNNYRLTMEDTTSGSLFTIDQTSNYGLRATAEWIAESPEINGSISSLANFGTATFLGASATINGTDTGTISNFSNTATQLISGVGGLDATPSLLNANGNGFDVTIGNTAPPGTTLTASGNVGMLAMTEFNTNPSSVPEPGMLSLMSVAGILLLVRRRKTLR